MNARHGALRASCCWAWFSRAAISPYRPQWQHRFRARNRLLLLAQGRLHRRSGRRNHPAQQTILIQAYSFTSAPIAKALVDAHQRGVQITVILDKSNLTGQYSSADFVLHASIPTYIDDKHAIAHNKIMLIDGRTIITGSFNFTKQAESSNAENLLVIREHPELFAEYEANFKRHLEHSQSYQGRGDAQAAKPDDGTAEPRAKSTRRRRELKLCRKPPSVR